MYLSKAMKVCVIIAILLNLQAALAMARKKKKGKGSVNNIPPRIKKVNNKPRKLTKEQLKIKLLKYLKSCESQLQSLNTKLQKIQIQFNKINNQTSS